MSTPVTHPTPTPHDPTSAPLVHSHPIASGTPGEDERSHHRSVRFNLALAIFLSLVDVILIAAVYNAILREDAIVSWLLATITAIGATALAWVAGHHAAIGVIDGLQAHKLIAWILGFAWAAIGASLTLLRWNTGELTSGEITYEGDPMAVEEAVNVHHLLALALIALYLLPGALAGVHGYVLGNPIAARERAVNAELKALLTELPHLEARAAEMEDLRVRHVAQRDLVKAEETNARAAADDLAEELKAFARRLIAEKIGQPWAAPPPVADSHRHTRDPLDPASRDGESNAQRDDENDDPPPALIRA